MEAAWTAANLGAQVALVTLDPGKIGAMSCNPAIGGLAKGQMVREIDALGGLMGLASDATGIQFRVLNRSKGPAVRGPRCQSDKYAYAREVQRLIRCRPNIHVLGASVEQLLIEDGRCVGVKVSPSPRASAAAAAMAVPAGADCCGDFGKPENDHAIDFKTLGDSPYDAIINEAQWIKQEISLHASAVVLTTGTFMRGLLHTGERKVEGGRIGEAPAVGISRHLAELGFDLGRLKTGTPPRLDGRTVDFGALEAQPGDDQPLPFSELTGRLHDAGDVESGGGRYAKIAARFPVIEQVSCYITHTNQAIHDAIRGNLDRAPMYNGQIVNSTGPRYCPSIEDKVMRFADRSSHHVYLEPESLETDEIYCNGISTSLPGDIQELMVRGLPGCEQATILRYGYAVEYDMVWPHQIDATCMTKRYPGLFLAGQINGTSGYEEAAGQGLLAGLNAVRFSRGGDLVRFRRDQAYIGVMMDDLVTKTPREPYRMFTSRAEFRLILRSDNVSERLTPMGRELGLVDDVRWRVFEREQQGRVAMREALEAEKRDGKSLYHWLRRPEVDIDWVLSELNGATLPEEARDRIYIDRLLSEKKYEGYIDRQYQEAEKLERYESLTIPDKFDYNKVEGLRNEARATLEKFRPSTMGQARRLAGVNPSDLMLITITMGR